MRTIQRESRGATSFLTVLLLVGFIGSANGQVRELWSHTHDGGPNQDDVARAIAVAPNGDVHVSGDSFTSAGPLVPHFFFIDTLTYDTAGNQLWSARFTPVPDARMHAWGLALSPQGDTYVAATLADNSALLLKYSSSGTLLWSQTYANLEGTLGLAIVVDSSGSVFLGGADTSSGWNYPGISKIDPLGNVVWTAHVLPLPPDTGGIAALALAPNGDVVGTGSVANLSGPSDVMAMRVDGSGNLMWVGRVDGPAGTSDEGFDVAVDAAGNVYVAGIFDVDFGHFGNQAVVAWDPNGVLLWSKDIDGPGNGLDEMDSIEVDPFGRIVAVGTITTLTHDLDVSIDVFDASGNSVWSRTFDGGWHGLDGPKSMALDAAGNIHIAGSTVLAVSFEGAGLSIGYDPTGELRYTEIVPESSGQADFVGFNAIAVGPAGEIALAGAVMGHDYLTVLLERTAVPYCFGDGSGTACPCGNTSTAIEQSGCMSSLGIGGRLIDSGASSLAADTFVLNGTHMSSSACLYFQGTSAVASGAGAVFGDGLRCAGGTVVRLSMKQNVSGQSQYPESGNPSVSVRGGITSPSQRTYQVWFRNAAPFCTSSTFNLTNGLRVTWIP